MIAQGNIVIVPIYCLCNKWIIHGIFNHFTLKMSKIRSIKIVKESIVLGDIFHNCSQQVLFQELKQLIIKSIKSNTFTLFQVFSQIIG
jgi:hypothetical protein